MNGDGRGGEENMQNDSVGIKTDKVLKLFK